MCGSTRKKKQTTELSLPTREMEINAVVGRKRGSVKINERGRRVRRGENKQREDEKTEKRDRAATRHDADLSAR